jgi:hypothetical protein
MGKGQELQFLISKLVSYFIQKAHSIELGNLEVEREFNDVRLEIGSPHESVPSQESRSRCHSRRPMCHWFRNQYFWDDYFVLLKGVF